MSWTVLLVAHGTVENLEDMEQFLFEIRRGRAASPELLGEMCAKYRHVGGSPLLSHTRNQASALERELGIPTRVAMRLWHPRVSDVCEDLGPQDRVCLVPLAPFSVAVYEEAARRDLRRLVEPPQLSCVKPWGGAPQLLASFAAETLKHLKPSGSPTRELVILTAHSLPQAVIDRGDRYQIEFESCAREVERLVGRDSVLAYQSQGADGGIWLGPTLLQRMQQAKREGYERVVISPIGFLSEHIETLYDLDVEARMHAQALELEYVRVPALGDHPGLVSSLASAARGTMAEVDAATRR